MVIVVEYSARVLNSTVHWLFGQGLQFSASVRPRGTYGDHVKSFNLFELRYRCREGHTIEEMREISYILKPGHCRACEMDFGNHAVMRMELVI